MTKINMVCNTGIEIWTLDSQSRTERMRPRKPFLRSLNNEHKAIQTQVCQRAVRLGSGMAEGDVGDEMREIKFRAWSIKDNSYINGCNMFGFVLGQGAPEEMLQRYDSKWKTGEFCLEQFTGLKGKNGKDLDWWEGDLFQESQGLLKQIIYEDGCFWLQSVKHTTNRTALHFCKEWADNIPKVGNIHENPELLK